MNSGAPTTVQSRLLSKRFMSQHRPLALLNPCAPLRPGGRLLKSIRPAVDAPTRFSGSRVPIRLDLRVRQLPRISLDPLAVLFGTVAAVLLVVFLVMLGSTQPRSKGQQLPYTTVQRMATAGQIRNAVQLDYD